MAINRQLRDEIADLLTARVEGRVTKEEFETRRKQFDDAHLPMAQMDPMTNEALYFMDWSNDLSTDDEIREKWLRYIAFMRSNLERIHQPIIVRATQWHWLGLVFILYVATLVWVIVDPLKAVILSLIVWLFLAMLMALHAPRSYRKKKTNMTSIDVRPFGEESQWLNHQHLVREINWAVKWNRSPPKPLPSRSRWLTALWKIVSVPVFIVSGLAVMAVISMIGLAFFPLIAAWSAFGQVETYAVIVTEQAD